jgi:hypothetical protein
MILAADPVDQFVQHLRHAMEFSPSLKRGSAFLPADLKQWKLSKTLFAPVMDSVRAKSDWTLQHERHISFPKDYGVWKAMRVDYAFHDRDFAKPTLYVELETLDRAQLYNFHPHPKAIRDESKLWHYYGLVAKHLDAPERRQAAPRALIFLLVLPDERVERYRIWDACRDYRLVDASVAELIRESPFRIYDPLIKATARLFLERLVELPSGNGHWRKQRLRELQSVCELVFVTMTRTHIVVSRGRDGFTATSDRRYRLAWLG